MSAPVVGLVPLAEGSEHRYLVWSLRSSVSVQSLVIAGWVVWCRSTSQQVSRESDEARGGKSTKLMIQQRPDHASASLQYTTAFNCSVTSIDPSTVPVFNAGDAFKQRRSDHVHLARHHVLEVGSLELRQLDVGQRQVGPFEVRVVQGGVEKRRRILWKTSVRLVGYES